ncbi:MAG TPA: DUF2784 domain-containing protein [Jatrophihabitantaceae bacterium]|jgi:hypothetical protein
MGYRLLGDTVAGVHYAYLAYLLVGGFVAWRWPRTIALHAVAAVWAVLITATPVPCPLTAAQNALRERGGQPPLRDSFINTYIRGTFYPAAYETETRVVVAGIVVASWVGFALRMRRRRVTRLRHRTAMRI